MFQNNRLYKTTPFLFIHCYSLLSVINGIILEDEEAVTPARRLSPYFTMNFLFTLLFSHSASELLSLLQRQT